ncbi:LPS export ABC transporter periplasmic protein LptC [Parasalinivibrio latis]|uniref:LPS export ABC transporter periplasmic protein LptC n=1 Tax=Parasalinivibrio latis TaxID=2952610 RepID=UPI0030DDE7BB
MTFQRLGIILLLVVTGYAGWYLLQNYYQSADVQVAPDGEKALFSAEGIKSAVFSPDGKISYDVTSSFLEYFAKIDETHFTKPVVMIYGDNGEPEWRIVSNAAILRGKQVLEMTGKVRIFNLLPQSTVDSISTESATLELKSHDFWSDDETTLVGKMALIRGQRMKGNYGNHTVELFDQVKGRYEVPEE